MRNEIDENQEKNTKKNGSQKKQKRSAIFSVLLYDREIALRKFVSQ
jgi:hypothetical protein